MSHLLAYIDPGSGSLIIQVVIATLVAIPIFFRTQVSRVLHAIRGDRSEAAEATAAGTEVQATVDDNADRA